MRRLLLMADRPLGALCLERMVATGAPPCAVVSRPDDDHQWWGRPAFQARCRELGMPWFDHGAPIAETVRSSRADFLVSVLFTRIVPAAVLARTPGVNLHCAPLPRHAGFNASLWAVLDAEPRFGATLHILTNEVDAGPIVDAEDFDVPPASTNAEVYALAHRAGLGLFSRALCVLLDRDVVGTPQSGVRRYHPRELPSREADLSWTPERIDRCARAFHFPPFEPAYLSLDGRKVHLVPELAHLDEDELRVWGVGVGAGR